MWLHPAHPGNEGCVHTVGKSNSNQIPSQIQILDLNDTSVPHKIRFHLICDCSDYKIQFESGWAKNVIMVGSLNVPKGFLSPMYSKCTTKLVVAAAVCDFCKKRESELYQKEVSKIISHPVVFFYSKMFAISQTPLNLS